MCYGYREIFANVPGGRGGGGTYGIVSRCTQNRPQASRGVYDIDLALSLLPQ